MKVKKIVISGVLLVIGLLVTLILTALACFSIMDKTNGSIVSSGVTRRYQLYVPRAYDRSKGTPLLISIHPAATWPAVEKNISRWNDLADRHGFLVVYPAGSGAFFGGFSRGPHVWPGEPQDVRFISDLIDKLETEYNIDPNRVYADGMSNGGGMAFELSCKLSDRIAAVGAVASAQEQAWNCGDSKPVATVACPLPGRAITNCPQPVCEYSGLDGSCGATKQMQRGSDRNSDFSERSASCVHELR